MNTERLLRLAAHLDTVPAEQFDLNNWAQSDECGTVCCAMGHACAIPEFAAAGLYLAWGSPSRRVRAELCLRMPAVHSAPNLLTGFRAAAELFGTTIFTAEYLFNPDSYDASDVSAGDVAQRIRELVATYAKAGAA